MIMSRVQHQMGLRWEPSLHGRTTHHPRIHNSLSDPSALYGGALGCSPRKSPSGARTQCTLPALMSPSALTLLGACP